MEIYLSPPHLYFSFYRANLLIPYQSSGPSSRSSPLAGWTPPIIKTPYAPDLKGIDLGYSLVLRSPRKDFWSSVSFLSPPSFVLGTPGSFLSLPTMFYQGRNVEEGVPSYSRQIFFYPSHRSFRGGASSPIVVFSRTLDQGVIRRDLYKCLREANFLSLRFFFAEYPNGLVHPTCRSRGDARYSSPLLRPFPEVVLWPFPSHYIRPKAPQLAILFEVQSSPFFVNGTL